MNLTSSTVQASAAIADRPQIDTDEAQALAASRPGGDQTDPALRCLSLVAGYFRILADPDALRHELALSDRAAASSDLVRAARLLGLKAKMVSRNDPAALRSLPSPAVLRLKGSGWGILVCRTNAGNYLLTQIGRDGAIANRE